VGERWSYGRVGGTSSIHGYSDETLGDCDWQMMPANLNNETCSVQSTRENPASQRLYIDTLMRTALGSTGGPGDPLIDPKSSSRTVTAGSGAPSPAAVQEPTLRFCPVGLEVAGDLPEGRKPISIAGNRSGTEVSSLTADYQRSRGNGTEEVPG